MTTWAGKAAGMHSFAFFCISQDLPKLSQQRKYQEVCSANTCVTLHSFVVMKKTSLYQQALWEVLQKLSLNEKLGVLLQVSILSEAFHPAH